MKIKDTFDVNVFRLLNEQLDAGIEDTPKNIGSSEIAYCMRKNGLKKRLGHTFSGNNKTLFGRIYEDILYTEKPLKALIRRINQQVEIPKRYEAMGVDTKKYDSLKVMVNKEDKGYRFRLHPDIYTNHYIVEVKTTGVYTKYWDRELAPYQLAQLNTYMGHYKKKWGFMHKINIRAFLSQINDTQPHYWDKLWENYGYLIPVEFDRELYDRTLERIKEYFIRLEAKDFTTDMKCPEFDWECKYCPVREECGKERFKCTQCGKYKMYEWRECLTPQFLANPICKNCFEKIFPRYKYENFKYIKKYPWGDG